MASGSSMEYTDGEEQLRAIRQTDEAVLRRLYQQHYPAVERFVLQNSGTPDQAKDVYQEAFLAVWRNVQLGRFELQQDAGIGAYLFSIARNKWRDHLRSSHHNKTVPLETDAELPQAITPHTEEDVYIGAVRKYFAHLGDNCKKVLGLFYFREETMKRIAAIMGWTEQTARNNKYRCLEKLRALIQDSQ